MNLLNTALGTIEILIDGEKIPYIAKEGRKIENLCPNVLGRYQIEVDYIPDGSKHSLSCVINNLEQINRTVESGENLECLSFYNKDRVKLSIALLGEQRDCHNGVLINATNDYDIEYLENGLSYIILEETKSSKFIFGVSWIDDVAWDDPVTPECQQRDTQTWFASDPSLAL